MVEIESPAEVSFDRLCILLRGEIQTNWAESKFCLHAKEKNGKKLQEHLRNKNAKGQLISERNFGVFKSPK